jgi:hypothetical protein
MESCLKDDNAADIYIKDAAALAKGTGSRFSFSVLSFESISLTSWFVIVHQTSTTASIA